ncbi:hypothetical protein TSOC_010257, partial [Tetrabaena socialis]
MRDLASGFHHVMLGPNPRRFVTFRHPAKGLLLCWVVLPLGASQSPPTFAEPAYHPRSMQHFPGGVLWGGACTISRRIAQLAVMHVLKLQAECLRRIDNARADRLSRRLDSAGDQNLRLKPSIRAEFDTAGANCQPGCFGFFGPARSVVGQEALLAGQGLWAFRFRLHALAEEPAGVADLRCETCLATLNRRCLGLAVVATEGGATLHSMPLGGSGV